MIFRRRQ